MARSTRTRTATRRTTDKDLMVLLGTGVADVCHGTRGRAAWRAVRRLRQDLEGARALNVLAGIAPGDTPDA